MISEVDIQDWDRLDPAPLYSVRPKTYIEWMGVTYWFDHIDGKDCHCLTWDNVVIKISGSAIVAPLMPKEKSK